jgi:hypothetical protein
LRHARSAYRFVGLAGPLSRSLAARASRIYDASLIASDLGFRCTTDFAAILDALRTRQLLPITHDPDYVSPVLSA